MTAVIEARGLAKSFGATQALAGVSLHIDAGRIVGLIGPNGAGKTTALKAILGLTPFQGELRVLGLDPRTQRDELMRDVCFMADVAVLPRWLRVSQALEYCGGVHPRFDRERAEAFLRKTDIQMKSRVRELSKGMVTQLHLALILAIDARLLVLDEPTLGLDLLYRRQFYDTLLNDYFDKERTILLTTHQVEEVENLFTDVIFISHGQVALATSVEELGSQYLQLNVSADAAAARARAQALLRARSVRSHRHVLRGTYCRAACTLRGAAHALDRRSVRRQDARDDEVMNTETADLGNAAAVSSTARIDTRGALLTLMRREFWEHAALWRVPLVVAALLAISTIFSHVDLDSARLHMIDDPARIVVLNMSQVIFALLIYLAASIVVTFYALDCLYAERKDRSILFWKSLPVSDGLTVLSKFLVAMVLVPGGVFLLAIASHLIALSIWELRVASGGVPDVVSWDTVAWVRGELVILLCLILSSLWYAPLVAASMLLSAWVKRGPILWAFLAPFLVWLLELIVFHTFYFWHFIQYRSTGIWHILATRGAHSVMSKNMRLLSDLNWAAAFTSLDLWLGVLAAAGLLYAAARVRRYRDDT